MTPGEPARTVDAVPAAIPTDQLDGRDYAVCIGPRQLLGAGVTLKCESRALGAFLDAFVEAFPQAPEQTEQLHVIRVEGRWCVYRNGVRVIVHETVPETARSLVWYLNMVALTAGTEHLLVHAAVAAVDGRAVLLPGRSGAGKTTLVASLALAGWRYLSDEVAPLDPLGMVHPYPRPLALEEPSTRLVPEALGRWPDAAGSLVPDLTLVLPSTIGAVAGPAPAQVAAIVFPEVAAGSTACLGPLSRAEALERLLPLAFNGSEAGVRGFDLLAGVVRNAACRRLVLDGLDGAEALLRGLMTA